MKKTMTITNAEWCIKNGIKFKNLKCECYFHSSQDSIGCYDSYGIYHEFYKGKALGDLTSESILTWLDMEHKEPILDDVEKRYLAGVIRPFREHIEHISKHRYSTENAEFIMFYYKQAIEGTNFFYLPTFKHGTMYKGMKPDKQYTLEELGL